MEKNDRNFLIGLGIIVLVFVVAIAGLFIYSGMSSPLTVVESGSMQHSDESTIGTIDTGDMVVMVNPNKTNITTYVDGYKSNYSKFGNYGDVIIYYRTSGNPVIHRAILWLDYNESTEVWSAPSLKDYPNTLWSVTSGDWNNLSGTLTMKFSNFKGGSYDVSISLSSLEKHSGYLTKGDNPQSNKWFDQEHLTKGRLIENDSKSIKAVAGIEIPWLGCIKLLINNKNVNQIQSNSIPCLIIMFIDIIMFFILLATIIGYFENKQYREKCIEESKKPVRHAKRK